MYLCRVEYECTSDIRYFHYQLLTRSCGPEPAMTYLTLSSPNRTRGETKVKMWKKANKEWNLLISPNTHFGSNKLI